MAKSKVIILELTELDVIVLLEALGRAQIRSPRSKAIRIMIDRIYRAMGVRL